MTLLHDSVSMLRPVFRVCDSAARVLLLRQWVEQMRSMCNRVAQSNLRLLVAGSGGSQGRPRRQDLSVALAMPEEGPLASGLWEVCVEGSRWARRVVGRRGAS